jgi:hypothetical protein
VAERWITLLSSKETELSLSVLCHAMVNQLSRQKSTPLSYLAYWILAVGLLARTTHRTAKHPSSIAHSKWSKQLEPEQKSR